MTTSKRPPYRASIAAGLLEAREAVMGPIRPILRAAGLTEQQWRVLRVLVDEGDADPTLLARAGLLYPPTVTRIIKELIDRGLVARVGDPQDGRRSIISASPQARQLVEQTAAKTLAMVDAYARRFGRERLAALQNELNDLVQCLNAGEELDEVLKDPALCEEEIS